MKFYWKNNLRINPRPRFAKEYNFEFGIASTMQLYVLFLTKQLKLFLSLIGKLVKKKKNSTPAVCSMLITILQEIMCDIGLYACSLAPKLLKLNPDTKYIRK